MKNAKKFQKFVEATRSLAYWSKELLKTIEQPDKKCQKQIQQDTKPKGQNEERLEGIKKDFIKLIPQSDLTLEDVQKVQKVYREVQEKELGGIYG